jgi:hypothetical protein
MGIIDTSSTTQVTTTSSIEDRRCWEKLDKKKRRQHTGSTTGTGKQTPKKRSRWRELEHGILLLVGRPAIVTGRRKVRYEIEWKEKKEEKKQDEIKPEGQ